MKLLAIVLIALGAAYAWFSFGYQPEPSENSMQGTINAFQEALMARNVSAMQRLCSDTARQDCARLIEAIATGERENQSRLERVGSMGFEYTRNQRRVEGQLFANDNKGEGLLSSIVVVEQETPNAPWRITTIR